MKVPSSKNEGNRTGNARRGRPTGTEWQDRARFVLRHLGDPIALQRSPLCQLVSLERLAEARYPNGIVARGRTLNGLVMECLQEIETELDGHHRVAKLKDFVNQTRHGKGSTEASHSVGVSPEYGSRAFKRTLVGLLTEKLLIKLRGT